MSAKKVLFVTASVLLVHSSTYAQWGRVKCLRECTDFTCSDSSKMETCVANCADSDLEACKTAKPKSGAPRPAQRPLPSQSSSTPSEKPAAPAPVRPSAPDPSSQYQPMPAPPSSPPPARPAPSAPVSVPENPLHKSQVAVVDGKELTAAQEFALGEDKGVKVKYLTSKIEGLEKFLPVIEHRLDLLGKTGQSLQNSVNGAKGAMEKLKEMTGLNKAEVRNDPKHDINFDPALFNQLSSTLGEVDGQSCELVSLDVQRKQSSFIKRLKGFFSAKKKEEYQVLNSILNAVRKDLVELCAKNKDLNRDIMQKIADAEKVNALYKQSKNIKGEKY